MKTPPKARQKPHVDPEVVRFMNGASCFLQGWDPKNANKVVWRRLPVAQGDEANYEFTTAEALKMGDDFYVNLIDSVFESGHRAGQRALKAKLAALLDPECE